MSENVQPETVSLGDTVKVIIPPNVQILMSGAWRLQIGAHEARLDYTDGTLETVPSEIVRKVMESGGTWFNLVSAVQAQREGGAK